LDQKADPVAIDTLDIVAALNRRLAIVLARAS